MQNKLQLPVVPADLADKYYSDEAAEGVEEAVDAAAAQAAAHAAQARADEAQAALDKTQGDMQELGGKRKHSPADEGMLAVLRNALPLMEAGLNACKQDLTAAKAATAKGKQCSKQAAKTYKSDIHDILSLWECRLVRCPSYGPLTTSYCLLPALTW
jgi:hypothetical protein